ncbi:MAG: homoserine kinase [Aggregatilineales bacterium]
MQKVRVRLPATLTNFGVSVRGVGLAIGLYVQVDVRPRKDDKLIIEPSGEGAGIYAIGLCHPVVLAMMRVFQRLERAPSGMTIRIQNDIPLYSGLGAEDAFALAGVIAANNLMQMPFSQDELLQIAVGITGRPERIAAAMPGGLAVSYCDDTGMISKSLPVQPFKLIVAVPRLDNYAIPILPDDLPAEATLQTMTRLPFLLEALREGDLQMLSKMFPNPLLDDVYQEQIPGYAHIAEVARLAGAIGMTVSGGGTAMVFLTERQHNRLAEVIENAFRNLDIPARVMIVPVDTQGIVISMMQSV